MGYYGALSLILQLNNMKYIGFIRENTNIKEALHFDDVSKTSIDYDEETLKKIKQYLSMGKFIFGWMGYSNDVKTKAPIAPDGYSTDGTWVWPDYYYYYIETYSIAIDSDFFDHMLAANFNFKPSKALLKSMDAIEDELNDKLRDPSK